MAIKEIATLEPVCHLVLRLCRQKKSCVLLFLVYNKFMIKKQKKKSKDAREVIWSYVQVVIPSAFFPKNCWSSVLHFPHPYWPVGDPVYICWSVVQQIKYARRSMQGKSVCVGCVIGGSNRRTSLLQSGEKTCQWSTLQIFFYSKHQTPWSISWYFQERLLFFFLMDMGKG